MVKYHVNKTTGVAGACRANISCPFDLPLEEHYPSKLLAMNAYAEHMAAETLVTYKRGLSPEKLRAIPANILRDTPLKELDASQLAQTLQHEAFTAFMSRDTISSAVDLATILHAHQTRGNRGNFVTTPYIEHPLRNAVRLLRLGVTDQDVIVAAVLHDTIEDGASVFISKIHGGAASDEMESRKILGDYIKEAYGSKVLKLVEAVTNDYIADTDKSRMTLAEKNRVYLEHVSAAIKGNAGVILVKISDLMDNASGLHHNDVPGREVKTKRQAMKYLPVVDVFLEEMKRTELPISDEALAQLRRKLNGTKVRLREIIARHSAK